MDSRNRPNISKVSEFRSRTPRPFSRRQRNALAACSLLVGLATRLISVPLMILLTVACLTADIDRVRAIFSEPDKFVTADEFLFLFAVVVVFVFGPGAFSADGLIGRYFWKNPNGTAK